MYNHEPDHYDCPFCRVIRRTIPGAIVYENEAVIAFLSLHQRPNNPGNTMIVPKAHYENLYDLPADLGTEVFRATQRIAIAMKEAFRCDGVSTRQHNEPAGDQDVWHYHVHVTPRFQGDDFYQTEGVRMDIETRDELARRLIVAMPGVDPEFRVFGVILRDRRPNFFRVGSATQSGQAYTVTRQPR